MPETLLAIVGDGPQGLLYVHERGTYLPFIVAEPVQAQGEPQGFLGELLHLIRTDARQQRPELFWDDRLGKAAQAHAEDMARRNYFSHESPAGIWPNERVRAQGFPLPASFANDTNNVESIAAGQPTPEEAWNAWMHSESHSTHLLGLTDFFADQTFVGIGYFCLPQASTYWYYWCIVTAPPI